jgi:hypothetical protein
VAETVEQTPPPPAEPKAPRTGSHQFDHLSGTAPGTQSQEQSPGSLANRTNQLSPTKSSTASSQQSKKLSIEEKARLQDQKIDNIAERITNVLKQLSDFKRAC